MVNLIYVHEFYHDKLDAQLLYQVCNTNVFDFFYLNINYLVLIDYMK
jgi:hypothetical protein